MKKKVIMAVFLVGILLIVGFSVYGLNKFFNSPEMLTKKYSEELGDVISLGENQKVIRVIKDYVDNDDVEDYVVLYGTEKYFEKLLTKVSIIGGLFAAFLAVTPILVGKYISGVQFGGTSLLILIGVALDFSRQLDSQLVMRHYDGFLK